MASMGPRAFARGDKAANAQLQAALHGFNGAASFRPRRCVGFASAPVPFPSASMGPRAFARGDSVYFSFPRSSRNSFNGAASFRPRRSKPGAGGEPKRVASMGPRAFARGDCWLSWWSFFGPRMLQWGRELSPAEIPLDPAQTGMNVVASMGPRAFARGDNVTENASKPLVPRFNGAASFRPRRWEGERLRR